MSDSGVEASKFESWLAARFGPTDAEILRVFVLDGYMVAVMSPADLTDFINAQTEDKSKVYAKSVITKALNRLCREGIFALREDANNRGQDIYYFYRPHVLCIFRAWYAGFFWQYTTPREQDIRYDRYDYYRSLAKLRAREAPTGKKAHAKPRGRPAKRPASKRKIGGRYLTAAA